LHLLPFLQDWSPLLSDLVAVYYTKQKNQKK